MSTLSTVRRPALGVLKTLVRPWPPSKLVACGVVEVLVNRVIIHQSERVS